MDIAKRFIAAFDFHTFEIAHYVIFTLTIENSVISPIHYDKRKAVIDGSLCVGCGLCQGLCPTGAIQ